MNEEWQKCIANTHEDKKRMSLCGKRLIGWHYMDIDHAFLSAPLDRIQPCPACADVVVKVFSEIDRGEL